MTDETELRRYRIPNPQIKDVADQFYEARRILAQHGREVGTALPELHSAVMAIELYLKSLASRDVAIGEPGDVYVVRAKPDSQTHSLTDLLSRVPNDVRDTLLSAFRARSFQHVKGGLNDALKPFNALLEASRYPFDKGLETDYEHLVELTDFIAEFVQELEPANRFVDPSSLTGA